MEKEKSYTGLFIINSERKEHMDDVKKGIGVIITENSGNIVKENILGERTLAYLIKKKKDGIYYEVIFKSDPESIVKMMKQFLISRDILRVLINKEK